MPTMQVLQVDHDDSLEPFTYERAELAADDIELVSGNCLTVDELVERAETARVLWLSWKPAIDRTVLERLPNVELVVRWGVGYDQIDVPAATELGVAVANAPDYGTIDVAEHVIGLLVGGARRIPWYHHAMTAGGFPEPEPLAHHRIHGRTLGLVGLGRIGRAVASRASALGLTIVGYDPLTTPGQSKSSGVQAVGLDELLAVADYVSLHAPLTDVTRHLLNRDTFAKMKPGSALINASRGPVVDTDAMLDSLASGHLAWAALDVYETEPLPDDSPLRRTPNVILTPHLAGFSEEAWADLRTEMCLTTRQWRQTGWADRVVNPEVRDQLRSGEGG